jgi:choline monooxygenase
MHLRDKLRLFDSELPLEQARTIPRLWYSDPEIHAAECQSVFGATWQAAARLEQLSQPGSFATTTIAGEPVLVLRDEQGQLRAFFNVCRHRAAVVVNVPCGHATKLRCRYHGWTYDLAGCLRGTPEFEGVADFRREENGLVPLTVDVWGPYVWVNMAGLALSLGDFLAPLPDRTAKLASGLRFAERREYELACNWKVFVDNYLDGGYHVNTVHPRLASALDYSEYRTELFKHSSVQSSPLKPGVDPALAKVRAGDSAYYWWVFPNFMLNLYEDVMDTNVVLPLGPERCRVIFDFFFAPDTSAEFIAQSIAVAEQIQHEDIGICADVQRGLGSRAYDTGRFSVRREAGGYHFHQLLARCLQAAHK